jgi:hypothetical protein
MPNEKPAVRQPESDAPEESEASEPAIPAGDSDAWGKPKTRAGGAPEEEAAGWKGVTEANRDE